MKNEYESETMILQSELLNIKTQVDMKSSDLKKILAEHSRSSHQPQTSWGRMSEGTYNTRFTMTTQGRTSEGPSEVYKQSAFSMTDNYSALVREATGEESPEKTQPAERIKTSKNSNRKSVTGGPKVKTQKPYCSLI